MNQNKQSTSKIKWGYQNQWVGLCEHDNPIEDKQKKLSFILKKIEF
jgi:hypothetical protein